MTPERQPVRASFGLRARLLTPLAAGGTYHEPDGLVLVDEVGRLSFVGAGSWDDHVRSVQLPLPSRWARYDANCRPGDVPAVHGDHHGQAGD